MVTVAPEYEPKEKVTIQTRFGAREFECPSLLTFPRGILGFRHHLEFDMAKLPASVESNFALLQSIDLSRLSFIVCCQEPAVSLIDSQDIAQACQYLGIEPNVCALILIANFQPKKGGFRLSVNLRAPILIDTANYLAWQHILSNEKYDVRHKLD